MVAQNPALHPYLLLSYKIWSFESDQFYLWYDTFSICNHM